MTVLAIGVLAMMLLGVALLACVELALVAFLGPEDPPDDGGRP